MRRWLMLLPMLTCALVFGASGSAAAHPWGTPPVAEVTSDGNHVIVHWQAEADDALVLGIELGLVDPRQLDWSSDGPQAASENTTESLLPPSEPLQRYLLDHIRVSQDGVRCPGEVERFADLVVDGATTVHVCPRPVAAVELEIGMLHDVHDAYRTFAQSNGDAQPRQAVFTASAPRHGWTFGAAASGGYGGALIQIAAVVGLAVVLAWLAVRRRRRRNDWAHALVRPEGRFRALWRTPTHGVVPVGVLAAAEQPRFGWLEEEFVELIDREQVGVLLGVAAVVIAFVIGAAHALAPGHGKALIGAYLVGARGRTGDAVALGTVVAVMHCASVLVLGGVLFTTMSLQSDVGQVVPWMGVAAGGLVLAVGIGLVVRQVRLGAVRSMLVTMKGRVHATHGHGHDHGHDQDNGHDHGHDHLDGPDGVRPLSRRGLVALGVSGGLLPSPSAFLVLATAIVMGRALFGFLLVLAFSLGLASTLTVFGLAAIKGRVLVERGAVTRPRLRRLTAVLPLLSSVAVLLGGLVITTLALVRLAS